MLNTSPVLEFKSSTFFAPILILFNNDMAAIEEALQDKISLAPEFFKDSPLIVDLRELNKQNQDLDFTQIVQILRRVGFFPVGIRGGNEQQNKQARALSIPHDTESSTSLDGRVTRRQYKTKRAYAHQQAATHSLGGYYQRKRWTRKIGRAS